jgi:hypothetical protein
MAACCWLFCVTGASRSWVGRIVTGPRGEAAQTRGKDLKPGQDRRFSTQHNTRFSNASEKQSTPDMIK